VIATRPGYPSPGHDVGGSRPPEPMTPDSLVTHTNCHIARTVSDVVLPVARRARNGGSDNGNVMLEYTNQITISSFGALGSPLVLTAVVVFVTGPALCYPALC